VGDEIRMINGRLLSSHLAVQQALSGLEGTLVEVVILKPNDHGLPPHPPSFCLVVLLSGVHVVRKVRRSKKGGFDVDVSHPPTPLLLYV